MKLAIDCDGVMYEWSKTARYMLRTYRGYDKNGPLGKESTYWNYIQDNVDDVDWKWLWSEGVDLGLFRYGHVVTGAIEGMHTLAQEGHKLSVVTHRPASAVNDTLEFLSYLAGDLWKWDGVHIFTNMETKTTVQADILVDDKPENLAEWAETGRTALRFVRPWNMMVERSLIHSNIKRADGWEGVVEYVRQTS